MVLLSRSIQANVLIVLSVINVARLIQASNSTDLLPRQNDDSVPPYCGSVCELGTCGSSTCPAKIRRRWLEPRASYASLSIDADRGLTRRDNQTSPASGHHGSLSKRVLRITQAGFPPARLSPRTGVQYSALEVKDYIIDNLQGRNIRDTQYQNAQLPYDAGGVDMRTVVNSREFGRTYLEFGAIGLHGCTMLTVISSRAVWQAHFWEGYAFKDSFNPNAPRVAVENPKAPPGTTRRDDGFSDDKPNTQSFQDRAIAAFTGQALSGAPQYYPTQGDPIDVNLFNGDGDNTIAWFMTPIKNRYKSVDPMPLSEKDKKIQNSNLQWKYPNKIAEFEAAISKTLPGVTIARIPYIPLDYYKAGDAAIIGVTNRGTALFQYDPNADGTNQGLRYYRLFYDEWLARVRPLTNP